MMLYALLISICVQPAQSPQPTPSAQPPLKVVAGNDIVADLVRAIGAEQVDLTRVGQAGGDPHHCEPTPADAKRIESAEVVFEFGLGLDRPIGVLHRSTGSRATLVVVATGLGLPRRLSSAPSGHDHAGHDHAGHDHADHDHACHDHADETGTAVDPHIWHDPSKVRILNERICAALVAARPSSAQSFTARSRDLDTKLAELDQWIKTQVELIAKPRRVLVTTHDGLRAFGERYGFEVIGVEMMGAEVDPAPKKIIAMVHAIQATKSPVVFGDAAHPSRIAATVAREAKVRLVETLHLDSLLQPPTVRLGEGYIATMRSNVGVIVEALKVEALKVEAHKVEAHKE